MVSTVTTNEEVFHRLFFQSMECYGSKPYLYPGASGPGGTDSEALHGWLLKVREDRKRIRTSVENFVDWLANGIPPWAAYCVFKFGHLIALDKQTGVRLVGFG